jgi:hypothetical protein
MKQAHQPALENHGHRNPRLGLSVMITEPWYYTYSKSVKDGAEWF